MSRVYRKYLKLLEKWPVDPTKAGRDLGQHLRDELKKAFGSGINFTGNEEQCEANYQSLKRITDNHYLDKYPRIYNSCGSGFSGEECKIILSDEFADYLENEQSSGPSSWLSSMKWKKMMSNSFAK